MANLKLQAVTKSYDGKNQIIQSIDLDVADGEFIVMVGPSGCGKSTLLRMVAGLERTTSGDIYINDQRVTELEPKDRGIAMVFQNYALYPHMSVFDNMAYGLKIRGFGKAQIHARVEEAARILELGPLLKRKPRELSGGQRQRVAMGRAIVREPAVFLFDEPLSNLDAKLRVQMRAELQALHKRLSTTSLYVTHDQIEAMTLANRMIVMNGGRAEQIGAPLDVYAKPASTFVASFIGSPPMNLIPAERAGRAVLHGVRPEHLEPCSAADAKLTAAIDLIEPLGADTLAHGAINGARIIVRLPAATAVREGALHLRFAPENEHFFDAASGKRID